MDPDLSTTLAAWNNMAGTNSVTEDDSSAIAQGEDPADASLGGGSGSLTNYLPEATSIGSTVLGAIGAEVQGQETAAADQYNAQLALEQGEFSVEQIGKEESQYSGTQQAMYAKAGVTQEGSPSDVMLETATNFEMDKQIAMFNAQSKANMDQYEAEVANQQATFNVGKDLLAGGSQLASLSGSFAHLG